MRHLTDETESLVNETFNRFFASTTDFRSAEVDRQHTFDANVWQKFVDLGGIETVHSDDRDASVDFVLPSLVAYCVGRNLAPVPFVEHAHALLWLEILGLSAGDLAPRDAIWTVVDGPRSRQQGSVLVDAGAIAEAAMVISQGQARVVRLTDQDRDPVRNLGRFPLARVNLASCPTITEAPLSENAERLVGGDRALLDGAWLTGAGDAALDLVVAHVKERHQFGRPIGSFQALQHRLADCSAQLNAAYLLVQRAARLEREAQRRQYLAPISLLAAANAAERTSRESIQMFGGYGVSDESDVPHILRMVKARKTLALDRADQADFLPRGLGSPSRVPSNTAFVES